MRLVRSPKRKLGIANLRSITQKEIREAMDRRVKPALVKKHEAVVKDWTSDVKFAAKTFIRADSIAVYVFPTGKDKNIWTYVDRGTKPHKIRAKKAPRLAFMMSVDAGGNFVRGGYVPKTMPVATRVVGGGYVKSPKALARPMEVDHPGTEPREFTWQIAREFLPEFRREVENAFRRAARKANGG